MEDTQTDQFIQKTKATPSDAKKYLQKHPNINEAVKVYQEHQKMIG